MTEKISYTELEEKLRDLNVKDEEIAAYFLGNPDLSRPFAPALKFNEDLIEFSEVEEPRTEAAIALGAINGLARARRKLRFRQRLNDRPRRPVLVTEGDSWFQFPFFLKDVIDYLADGDGPSYSFNIYSLGAGGDTTMNMVFGNPEYLDALDDVTDMGLEPAALIFSGGGNDILGLDEAEQPVFHSILCHNPSDLSIEKVLNGAEVAKLFDFLSRAYRSLFSHVHSEYPDLPIFIHGYDYVYPDDFDSSDKRAPLYAAKDQYIGGPMAGIGITDPPVQRRITNHLLDRFRALQQQLVDTHDNVYLVDTLGTLDSISMWNDEIHPNNDGFERIAQKFFDKIKEVLAL